MIRVTEATYTEFAALHARREAARARGQIIGRNDRLTHSETVAYLIKVEQALQARRRRSRKRRVRQTSRSPKAIDSATALYTHLGTCAGIQISGDEK
jgi:hypothetical protein